MASAAKYIVYRKLARDRRKVLDDNILDVEAQLYKMYKSTSKRIINEITALYTKIISNNETPSLNDLYQFNRYYELLADIQEELKVLTGKEEISITKKLTNLYVETSKLATNSIGLNTSIDKKVAESAIKRIWAQDGIGFSTRIWNKQAKLQNMLSLTLTEAVTTGKSVDWLSKELQNTFNVSFNDARRLARTEMAHAHNQAAIDRYKESGIKEYMIITANDDKVCGKCQSLSMQKFSIENTENLPPFATHPNCRCCVVAVIDDIVMHE